MLISLRKHGSKEKIDLFQVGADDHRVRNIANIALIETEDRGDAGNLSLGFEGSVEVERFVNIDHQALYSVVWHFVEPLMNVRLDALARPTPSGAELNHNFSGIFSEELFKTGTGEFVSTDLSWRNFCDGGKSWSELHCYKTGKEI